MVVQDIPRKIIDRLCAIQGVVFDETFLIAEIGLRTFLIYSTNLSDYRFGLKSYFEIVDFAQKLSGDSGISIKNNRYKYIETMLCENVEDLGVFTEAAAIHLVLDGEKELTIIEFEGESLVFPGFVFRPIVKTLQIDSFELLKNHFPELVRILKELHEREKMAFKKD